MGVDEAGHKKIETKRSTSSRQAGSFQSNPDFMQTEDPQCAESHLISKETPTEHNYCCMCLGDVKSEFWQVGMCASGLAGTYEILLVFEYCSFITHSLQMSSLSRLSVSL